jgi:hypothetical protein
MYARLRSRSTAAVFVVLAFCAPEWLNRPGSAGCVPSLVLRDDGLWAVTRVTDLPEMRGRGRSGILEQRWPEFWADRQAGMMIRDLVAKYGVSRGYVFTLLRRLRAQNGDGAGCR